MSSLREGDESLACLAADRGSLRCLWVCLHAFGPAACAKVMSRLCEPPELRKSSDPSWLTPCDGALPRLERTVMYLAACFARQGSPFFAPHAAVNGSLALAAAVRKRLPRHEPRRVTAAVDFTAADS